MKEFVRDREIPELHLKGISSSLTADYVKSIINDVAEIKYFLEPIAKFRDFDSHEACVKAIKELQSEIGDSDVFEMEY